MSYTGTPTMWVAAPVPAVPLMSPEMVFIAVLRLRYIIRSPPMVHTPNIPFIKSGSVRRVASRTYAMSAVEDMLCTNSVVVLSVIL